MSFVELAAHRTKALERIDNGFKLATSCVSICRRQAHAGGDLLGRYNQSWRGTGEDSPRGLRRSLQPGAWRWIPDLGGQLSCVMAFEKFYLSYKTFFETIIFIYSLLTFNR